MINLSRNVYRTQFRGSCGTVSDCVCSASFSALGDESFWPYPKTKQRWKDTRHWGSQGNVPVISLYPNEVFVSSVVGTPFHLCKKKENLSLTGLAGFASAEVIVKSEHWGSSYSSRQKSV